MGQINFNTSRVRLEAARRVFLRGDPADFNTSRVRLEVSYRKIAARLDERFQYLKGAIRGLARHKPMHALSHFNTSRVRLEALRVPAHRVQLTHFNTSRVRLEAELAVPAWTEEEGISIPQGCD